jgi:hypothetical protein
VAIHNFVLLTKYFSDEQIKKNEMGGARGTYRGQEMCAYRVLVMRFEGSKPLGRPKRGWEDNLKWVPKI